MFLHEQHCEEKISPPLLSEKQIKPYQKEIPEWEISLSKGNISRTFRFKNYNETLLFINAVTKIVCIENHHPNICFGYNHCTITYSTHSAKGITLFDFICAAKIEQLLTQQNFKT